MKTIKQRIAVTLVSTLLGMALGVGFGFLIGKSITLRQGEGKLSQDANAVTRQSEAFAKDSRSAMKAIAASTFPLCSDADLHFLRDVVLQSLFLKEAGRIREGRIVCSAALGLTNQPGLELPKADFSQPDGTMVYRNLPWFHIQDANVITSRWGAIYVVFNPYVNWEKERAPVQYTVTLIDAAQNKPGALAGNSLKIDTRLLTHDGNFRQEGSLFATRCSQASHSCVTAFMTDAEALHASRGELGGFVGIGGFGGALVGFLSSLLYRRNRSREQQLLRAIRRGDLRVVYQPVVDLASHSIVGAEALVRWTDEDGVVVGPDVFVKIAEASGFVGELTKLVIGRVLRDFNQRMRDCPGFQVNVNVTAADLADPAFLPMLESALRDSGVAPQSLGIEITESASASQKVAKDAILQLRARGHRVYIDDFGTGYSSLSYLQHLSIDAIKIDRAFTQAIGTDAVTVGILPQILAMAAALNLQVVVEGVETPEQAGYFPTATLPVLAQGWLFGHPFASQEFHQILAEGELETQSEEVAAKK